MEIVYFSNAVCRSVGRFIYLNPTQEVISRLPLLYVSPSVHGGRTIS
jgi:hypothetical protein